MTAVTKIRCAHCRTQQTCFTTTLEYGERLEWCYDCCIRRIVSADESSVDEPHEEDDDDEYALAWKLSHVHFSPRQWCALWDCLYCNPYKIPRMFLTKSARKQCLASGYRYAREAGKKNKLYLVPSKRVLRIKRNV